jgi:hypothetical protein
MKQVISHHALLLSGVKPNISIVELIRQSSCSRQPLKVAGGKPVVKGRPIPQVIVICLSLIAWTPAFAHERADVAPASGQPPGGIRETIRQMSFAELAPAASARQNVATTTESKLMLGLATGGLIVGGLTMMAYGASSSCKSKQTPGTSGCDRTTLIGTVTFSSGAAMALLWALSRD